MIRWQPKRLCCRYPAKITQTVRNIRKLRGESKACRKSFGVFVLPLPPPFLLIFLIVWSSKKNTPVGKNIESRFSRLHCFHIDVMGTTQSHSTKSKSFSTLLISTTTLSSSGGVEQRDSLRTMKAVTPRTPRQIQHLIEPAPHLRQRPLTFFCHASSTAKSSRP